MAEEDDNYDYGFADEINLSRKIWRKIVKNLSKPGYQLDRVGKSHSKENVKEKQNEWDVDHSWFEMYSTDEDKLTVYFDAYTGDIVEI